MDITQTVGAVRGELDELTRRIVEQVWEHIPGYEGTRMRRGDLEQVVRPNVEAVLAALTERRRPRDAELEHAVRLGGQRALQGVPMEAVLRSWSTAERLVLDALLANAREVDAAELRRVASLLGLAFDRMVAASVAAYRRAQEQITVRFERLTADLVATLAGGGPLDPAGVAAAARRIDVDPDRPYQAAMLGLRPTVLPAGVQRLHRHVLARVAEVATGRILSGTAHGHLLLLVPHEPPGRLALVLQRALDRSELGTDTVATVGEPRGQLVEVGGSCEEARAALEVALRLDRFGTVVAYAQVLPEVLLTQNRPATASLVRSRLGPLRDRPELLATLHAWLEGGLSVRATARRLAVHDNTVTYRLDRITRLTGRDPRDPAHLLDLALALRALPLTGT